ncbi:fatty-acid--CoA ligase [Burkholderia sp. MSh2]|uniref:Putative AMP-binding protein n=1 Tax=Burkholderia paludis TaxID=1506587 RepID=A0A6J5F6X4_9BURK|nr:MULTISPECIES: long-chain fatty acid--CoA ligase [Burkholderia]KEZ01198.1 fatty-acid--CoA ligase [Burkholderia sp. MSh2]CAB3773352.1 3-[(3aS,4S,7aS)-7a-methyl-1, 5-dioxo-octahydro-1H-inden-4-yl]propanoyl:CoA ligase [Burkholderia paludis]VWC45098.1 putative AMP-binding protein [Burkholderia paludis]
MYLTQALHKAARERPTTLATVFAQRHTSYARFVQRVARLAGALDTLGIEPGDRVGMLAPNSDRYVEYLFGTLWAGAVINPVNTRWTLNEIAYSLQDCETTILLVDDAFLAYVGPLRERCACLREIVYCGDAPTPVGMHGYEQLLEAAEPVADRGRHDNDLAAVLYTGGTTGTPKGVMLSHANLLSDALSTLAAAPRPPVEVALHVAPLFHVGGIASVIQTMLRSATHVILPGFDPKVVLDAISRHKVNEVFLVPTMLQMLLDDPLFADHDVSSLRNIIYGAAPIDSALLTRALSALPHSQFMQVYGMTELAPVVAVLPAICHTPGGSKLNAAGRPAPICAVRILDPDTHEERAAGTTGEVVVSGPNVMLGYWNKPDETAKALCDGWMHTGDGGYLDEDGYLHITDRLKDMIVSGGENVYSTEVENAILSHPAVQSCAVIGIPDEKWGEAVHAVVVVRDGAALTVDHLKAHCRERIAGYKCPRSIEFRDALPLSAAGKLLKYKLRETFWNKR